MKGIGKENIGLQECERAEVESSFEATHCVLATLAVAAIRGNRALPVSLSMAPASNYQSCFPKSLSSREATTSGAPAVIASNLKVGWRSKR